MRTCANKGKRAGKEGEIRIKLSRRSMYVMSGLSRYALKHGVIDASREGDRVSLTFRKCVRLQKDQKQWEEPMDYGRSVNKNRRKKKLHFPIGSKKAASWQ